MRNTNQRGQLGDMNTGAGSGTGAAGGWVDEGTTVRLDTAADRVALGAPSFIGSEKFRILGTTLMDLGIANEWIQFLSVDAYSRSQIWHTGPDSVLRLGAATTDGDAFGADSDGIVIYKVSDDELGRFKADRFGLTRSSDSSLYYFRVDKTALFYRADPPGGAIHFYVNRSSGFVGIGTDTPLAPLHIVGNCRFDGDLAFDNGTNRNIQIDDAADDTNGDQLYEQAGKGGNSAAAAGRQGGRLWLRSGPGGNCSSGSHNGGLGGILEMWAGYGGQSDQGGNTAGGGGVVHLYGGEGGYGTNGADGGDGGQTSVQGGTGGSTAGGGTEGDGGAVLVRGGGSVQSGGEVTINGGGGGVAHGAVNVGAQSTLAVNIGNAADNPRTTFLGTGIVTLPWIALEERPGNPGGTVNQGKLFTKDVAGVTELFYQRSDGTFLQLS